MPALVAEVGSGTFEAKMLGISSIEIAQVEAQAQTEILGVIGAIAGMDSPGV